MDARGLVAFIVTVHELAAILALLIGALVALLSALVLRKLPPGRRAFAIFAFAVGGALLTFAGVSRLAHVTALDVEVVRVGE